MIGGTCGMARWPAGPMRRRRRFAPPRSRPAAEAPGGNAAAVDAELKRIDEIIRNARATWFALLAALVFAGITLASVRDVAFFVTSERTQLPLVNISVPVNSFFMAGSLLIAAFYIHFHVYLERLWQALGAAPARIGGKPLADCLHPWVVADAALRFRDRLRPGEEPASAPRSLAAIGNVAAIVLVWLFGLQIVGWFWWRSMPAHDPVMTGWIAAVLFATLGVFLRSGTAAHACLAKREAGRRWWAVFVPALLAIGVLTVVRTWVDPWEGQKRETVVSLFRCPPDEASTDATAAASSSAEDAKEQFCWTGFVIRVDFLRPAPANLREVVFTEKPKDWLGLEIAETEFRVRWCKEKRGSNCANPLAVADGAFSGDDEMAFQNEWQQRRTALLAAMPKPDLRGKDLRGADLTGASLEGAYLGGAGLEGANLRIANLEGADLRVARLKGAILFAASLEGAKLSFAGLEHADLWHARLEGADLSNAEFRGAQLGLTRFERADLSHAKLKGAKILMARFDGANLAGAKLEDVDFGGSSLGGSVLRHAELKRADLSDADLSGARLEHADLSFVRFFGDPEMRLDLNSPFLNASEWAYSALRDVDMRDVNMADLRGFETSFGDGSVDLPRGHPRPCQWASERLDDAAFFGRWRGWREATGVPAFDLDDYPAIPPRAGCGPVAAGAPDAAPPAAAE